jgi:DNA-binding PadR family transcriptional regulator
VRVPTVQRTAVQGLTTTEAAVLSLLAIEGEHSGYELMKAVTQAIAHVWAPARSGLYAALPRLVRLGLARSRAVSQASRPDKQVYAISREGRAALDAWLQTVEPGARETFFLKLFVGGLTTPDVLLRHVDQFVADAAARLEVYRAIEPSNTNRGHDWYHRHLLVHALERGEQELAWARRVRRSLLEGPK